MQMDEVSFIDLEILSPCCRTIRERIIQPGKQTGFHCAQCDEYYEVGLQLTRPQVRFRRPVESPVRESKAREEALTWLTELGNLDPLSSEVVLAELLEAGLSQASPRGVPTFERAMRLEGSPRG